MTEEEKSLKTKLKKVYCEMKHHSEVIETSGYIQDWLESYDKYTDLGREASILTVRLEMIEGTKNRKKKSKYGEKYAKRFT